MFCLECGTEMAVRARACPACGHIYSDRELSLVESQPAAIQSSPAFGTPKDSAPASREASRVKYIGDITSPASPSLPRDLPGRFVLGVSLGMAADLLLPWVNFNNERVTPASIGAPVVVVLALLAAAILPIFTPTLRQHPIWSALPLMVGAFCAGIAGTIWLLLAPLAQIFAISFGSDPSNLVFSPESGLYLFLVGAAVLLVSGQRVLAATRQAELAAARLDAIHSLQIRQTGPTAPPPRVTPPAQSTPAPESTRAQTNAPTITGAPAAPITSGMPVAPAADAPHQAPNTAETFRSGPGSAWTRSRRPQRLR